MAHRILVVDDDPHIREVICFALDKAGLQTASAKDGTEALAMFERQAPSLIVLDVGMPEIDGLEVCRRVRKTSDVPILFLSARDEEIDRVLGLEMGGDDYVTKPFSPRELVARVNAILKRAKPSAAPAGDRPPLVHGSLSLDRDRHGAAFDGKPLGLTAHEFAMLAAILGRPGAVFSREQIMGLAYEGNIFVSERTIDSHIRNIRAKLAALGCRNALETVHGVGFRLGPCTADG